MKISLKYKVLMAVVAASGAWSAVTHAEHHRGSQQRDPAFQAAFEACITENGLTKPTPGQRPSDAERQVLETCLTNKGFTRADGHRHGPQASEAAPPAATPQ
jgi:hypothetical protein